MYSAVNITKSRNQSCSYRRYSQLFIYISKSIKHRNCSCRFKILFTTFVFIKNSPAVLKKSNYQVFCSRLLLILFVAGQVILYSHQHKFNNTRSHFKHHTAQQTVTEKCQLCDAMHHNTMVVGSHYYAVPVVVSHYDYKAVTYTFVSLSLILSTGRAPPVS